MEPHHQPESRGHPARSNGASPSTEEQGIVFIVDDDPSVRAALEDLLGSIGLNVQSFGTVQEFLDSRRPDAAGCIVLDVRLPGTSGLEFQRLLARSEINLPIIFISGHSDIAISVQAMKLGAIEFLTKPLREQELVDAVQFGIARERARRQKARRLAGVKKRLQSLTPREREVFELVIAGRQSKIIAADLKLSVMTVKVHRSHVMRKMGAKSLMDLARMANSLGIPAQD
ncbi:MAG: response regulator [Xanthobacteraceae bacterium]